MSARWNSRLFFHLQKTGYVSFESQAVDSLTVTQITGSHFHFTPFWVLEPGPGWKGCCLGACTGLQVAHWGQSVAVRHWPGRSPSAGRWCCWWIWSPSSGAILGTWWTRHIKKWPIVSSADTSADSTSSAHCHTVLRASRTPAHDPATCCKSLESPITWLGLKQVFRIRSTPMGSVS